MNPEQIIHETLREVKEKLMQFCKDKGLDYPKVSDDGTVRFRYKPYDTVYDVVIKTAETNEKFKEAFSKAVDTTLAMIKEKL
ncbi:MAG: hypothetical protein IBJ09_02405 [Bacteroidia bacterium]|nr:hypothetical protein [Bacteroidia bacterium]